MKFWLGGSTNSTYKNTPYRLDKSRSASAEARLKMVAPVTHCSFVMYRNHLYETSTASGAQWMKYLTKDLVVNGSNLTGVNFLIFSVQTFPNMEIEIAQIWIQNIEKISFQLKFVHWTFFIGLFHQIPLQVLYWTIEASSKNWISRWQKLYVQNLALTECYIEYFDDFFSRNIQDHFTGFHDRFVQLLILSSVTAIKDYLNGPSPVNINRSQPNIYILYILLNVYVRLQLWFCNWNDGSWREMQKRACRLVESASTKSISQ